MCDQVELAGKHTALAESQLLVARKRWETKLISDLEYHVAGLSLEVTKSRERIVQIDLLLAHVALRLTRAD